MIEKVREYIKEYYKDKEITNIELNLLNRTKLTINDKTVNLADLLKFCTPYLPEDCKYSERLYNIIYNIYTRPICPVCNTNICKFKNYYIGYFRTCSMKCGKKHKAYKEKYKTTCLERYGTENPLQSNEIKEKSKQTCLDKYSSEYYIQTNGFKEKSKQTCLQNYGVEYASKSQVVKEKIKNTCIERYGVHTTLLVPEIQEKIKQTNIANLGVENPFYSKIVQDKIKISILTKYGVENPFQVEEFKEKSRQTCIEKYGKTYYNQTEEFKEKYKETCIDRYGVENYTKTDEYKIKYKNTCLERYGISHILQDENIKIKLLNSYKSTQFNKILYNPNRLNNCIPLFTFDEFKNNNVKSNYKWKWQCNVCNTIFYDDLANGASPVCPICYKKYGSNLQKEVYEWLNTYNLDTHINNRQFGFEIDLFLKDYNLGIEVNGNYWHSDLHGKDKYYHLNKTIEAGKNNITLIHIFEDDWLYRKDIVKNIILDKLNLIDNIVNNLSIYKITNDMVEEFLNNNCINGNINQNNIIHYGLCDLNDIYYLISIQDNKIIRYCSKLGYKVDSKDISKLILHIIQENNLDSLIIQCDLRYDTGELFKDLNFNYLKFKHPTYDYVNKKNYLTRVNKDNLIFESYDDKLSIWYNAINNNYDRIWNCGYIIYEYNL